VFDDLFEEPASRASSFHLPHNSIAICSTPGAALAIEGVSIKGLVDLKLAQVRSIVRRRGNIRRISIPLDANWPERVVRLPC
jgi:hypothetical protein